MVPHRQALQVKCRKKQRDNETFSYGVDVFSAERHWKLRQIDWNANAVFPMKVGN
jgi:hypothetical protein